MLCGGHSSFFVNWVSFPDTIFNPIAADTNNLLVECYGFAAGPPNCACHYNAMQKLAPLGWPFLSWCGKHPYFFNFDMLMLKVQFSFNKFYYF